MLVSDDAEEEENADDDCANIKVKESMYLFGG